jgi:hypothetical protein
MDSIPVSGAAIKQFDFSDAISWAVFLFRLDLGRIFYMIAYIVLLHLYVTSRGCAAMVRLRRAANH